MPTRKNRALYSVFISILLMGGWGQRSHAALSVHYQSNQPGDFTMIGNTSTYSCHPEGDNLVVGLVDLALCRLGLATGLFFKVDLGKGTVVANASIGINDASSAAVLKLPPNAKITYARLYWSAVKKVLITPLSNPDFLVHLSNTTFSKIINPDKFWYVVRKPGLLGLLFGEIAYQGTADVTSTVQAQGGVPYQVSGIPSLDLLNILNTDTFVGWSMVVFYQVDGSPIRSLVLADGFEEATLGHPVNATLGGFVVPSTGINGKLGVVGYGGRVLVTGNTLKWNNQAISDALNPATNFLNSTHSYLGSAVSVAGDLPQTTGNPGTMNGLDLDVVDISDKIKSGDTQGQVVLENSSTQANKRYDLGVLVASIAAKQPSLGNTNKVFVNQNVHPQSVNQPGDIIKYTITVPNTGNDTATNVLLTDILPPEVTYQPGSLALTTPTNKHFNLTDAYDGDAGKFDPATRTIQVKLGDGVDASHIDGKILVNASATIEFTVKINPGVAGYVYNQATVSAQGETSGTQTPPVVFPSGDGNQPNVPTKIFVTLPCSNNLSCPSDAPICDLTKTPHQCISCETDQDCSSLPDGPLACQEVPGKPNKQCVPTANLKLEVKTSALDNQNQVTYELHVTNQGPGTAPGATVVYQIPDGVKVQKVDAGALWTCEIQDIQVLCASNMPIPKGEAPSIQILVQGTGFVDSALFDAVVTAQNIVDPDLSDNEVKMKTFFTQGELTGGGIFCHVTNSPTNEMLVVIIFSLGLLGGFAVRSSYRKKQKLL